MFCNMVYLLFSFIAMFASLIETVDDVMRYHDHDIYVFIILFAKMLRT